MIQKTVLAQLLLCGLCGSALAQGYFDFDNIPGVPEQPNVQVDLNAGLLAFAVAATRENDPATADLLEAIEGIRVRVYETLVDRNAVSSFVDEASRQLEGQGWQRVVFVQDAGSKVRVYSRMDGEQLNGMTVMVLDAQEAVFVDIAGRFDPAQLGRIVGAVGLGDVVGGVIGAPGTSTGTGQ